MKKIILCISLLAIVSFHQICGAQTVVFENDLFSFKIDDNLKYEVLEGIPVYRSADIFLDVDEIKTFDNAAKYADALENKFLDMDDVYTDREVDTLDGWPVIFLRKRDKRKETVFVQEYYIFDDGDMVYCVCLSGDGVEKSIMQRYFRVTKESFKFKTKTFMVPGMKLELPIFMEKDEAIGIWSNLYNKDETICIPLYMYRNQDTDFDRSMKDNQKGFKSLKPSQYSEVAFKAGVANGTKFSATYRTDPKIPDTEKMKFLYLLQHPQGGSVRIFFSCQPKEASIMTIGLERALQTAVLQ